MAMTYPLNLMERSIESVASYVLLVSRQCWCCPINLWWHRRLSLLQMPQFSLLSYAVYAGQKWSRPRCRLNLVYQTMMTRFLQAIEYLFSPLYFLYICSFISYTQPSNTLLRFILLGTLKNNGKTTRNQNRA